MMEYNEDDFEDVFCQNFEVISEAKQSVICYFDVGEQIRFLYDY